MQYDTRSQIYDQCVASANCPLPQNVKGITDYIGMGVEPHKLVMGVPWYGYSYGCINADDGNTLKTCEIKQIPFQGVGCSDAAGFEVAYADIMSMYENPE